MNHPTPMTPEERDALAGEYVLGTLPAALRREVGKAMENDPLLARAVRAWEERLLPLAALAEPLTPPQRLWGRIERSLSLRVDQPRPFLGWLPGWNSLPLWRGLTAAALTIAAFMGTTLLTQPPAGAPPRFVVVLVAPQDKAPGWIIQSSNSREVSLIPLGAFEVPANKALQFWTKADNWKGPVSLGLVKPGQRLQVPLDKLPPLEANQLFELTLEPATGSPIGKPTGPIQFIGRAVPVT